MNKPKFNRKPGKGNIIYFQIGMIISLTIVLLAFEWRTERKISVILSGTGRQGDLEMVPITKQPIKKKEIPKKPEPAISKLEVKENTADVKDIDFTAEVKPDAAINQDIPLHIEDPEIEDIVFVPVPQESASFPGGYAALQKYLAAHLIYTREARQMGIEGKIWVYFEVSPDGSLSNISIIRGLGYGLDEEVIRVLEESPKWNPGKQGGRAVKSPFRMPVVFNLD